MASYLYFIIPVGVIIFSLKCCFLFWRIYFYQQRREQRLAQERQIRSIAIERERAARLAAQRRAMGIPATRAGGTSVTRIVTRRQDGTQEVLLVPTACLNQLLARQAASRLSAQGARPSAPPSDNAPIGVVLTPEDILLGATGRLGRNDPNMPPSYDQAVTGRDKSVKVEEGVVKTEGVAEGTADVPPPAYEPQEEDTTNPRQPLLS